MKNTTPAHRSQASKVVFALSVATVIYWLLVMTVDVYRFALAGALYEILWLPMIAAIFVMPAVALIYWILGRFRLKSLHLYSLLLLLAAGLVIFLTN
ncbi:MAG TPA: hypothetical protein VJ894_00270 [Cryomorphaceae bacterium]|nr:hypothetical protein [Cryomorphaceae bacterium]